MKHTPGRCDECIFVRDMGTKERYVVPCQFHASTDDLLEALEELLPIFTEVVIDGGCDHSVGICACNDIALADKALKAIKKAKGE